MLKLPIPVVCALSASLAGCGGASSPAQEPPRPAAHASAQPESSPAEVTAARPSLSAQACEASGGALVGDIGDGAIHRPEFRCPNGAKPSGSIRAAEGAPIAVEGSVCCPR